MKSLSGLGLAGVGVLAFSFTMPATELALEGLDPYLIGFGRAAVAALLALPVVARSTRPRGPEWGSLLIVSLGAVFGFPLLSTLALHSGASASHGAVMVGLLPGVTAVFGALRAGERPPPGFWMACAAGACCVTGFALLRSGGRFGPADLLLVAAVLVCGAAYAEGGRLSRTRPGSVVISWALVLSAPVTVPVTLWLFAVGHSSWTVDTSLGFAYVSGVSMFLGFFAWYAGLGRAGIARAGQTQLAQPLLTICWAALVLGERPDPLTGVAAVLVVACVAWAQRARTAPSISVAPVNPVVPPGVPTSGLDQGRGPHTGARPSPRFQG